MPRTDGMLRTDMVFNARGDRHCPTLMANLRCGRVYFSFAAAGLPGGRLPFVALRGVIAVDTPPMDANGAMRTSCLPIPYAP